MVDYVKFKHSSPLSWKSKKFDGSRYKEYLYGSVESLDMDWADKIVDFNPDLRLDTNGFTKYVDRNASMSTDCGLDFSSSLTSNHEMQGPDDLSLQNYEPGRTELQAGRLVLNPHPKDSPPTLDGSSVAPSEPAEPQSQRLLELQRQHAELTLKFEQLRKEHEALVTDAELYRSCKERMNPPKLDFEPESDPRQSLELLLDQIYSILTDAFGPENTLSVYLEKFANLYLGHQSQVELELAALRTKAEVVDSLEKLVSERKDYERLLEQRDKTIESLVEELRSSKASHSSELSSARGELEDVRGDLDRRVQELEQQLAVSERERESLEAALGASKDQYRALLADQHQILSQIPLATLKVTGVAPGSTHQAHHSPFGPHAWSGPYQGTTPTGASAQSPLKIEPWPRSSTEALKPNEHPSWTRNSTDSWQPKWSRTQTPSNTPPALPQHLEAQWPAPADRPRELAGPLEPIDLSPSRPPDNDAFHQSLLRALYKRNEEALETIGRKEAVIRKQAEAISRLQECVKEWESDAVLWLDYMDLSSSLLNAE